jgi:hypothetical protein
VGLTGAVRTMAPSSHHPDSPDCQHWCRQCSAQIHAIEPRLALPDCEDLANSLWQLDSYQRMPPQAAAQKFMSENMELLSSVLNG